MTVAKEEYAYLQAFLNIGGPGYDLGPLRELIAWRDDYRQRRNPEAT